MKKKIIPLLIALSSTLAHAGPKCPDFSGRYQSEHPQFQGIVFEIQQSDCAALNLLSFKHGKQIDEPDLHLMDGVMHGASEDEDGQSDVLRIETDFYSNKWVDGDAVFLMISKGSKDQKGMGGTILGRNNEEIPFYKFRMVLKMEKKDHLSMYSTVFDSELNITYEDAVHFVRIP